MLTAQKFSQEIEERTHITLEHQIVRVRQEPKRLKLTVVSIERLTPKWQGSALRPQSAAISKVP